MLLYPFLPFRFLHQLTEMFFGHSQTMDAFFCGPVKFSPSPSLLDLSGHKVAFALHGMKHGIQGPRAELVTVICQFIYHPLPKDLMLGGMMQHMQANQS